MYLGPHANGVCGLTAVGHRFCGDGCPGVDAGDQPGVSRPLVLAVRHVGRAGGVVQRHRHMPPKVVPVPDLDGLPRVLGPAVVVCEPGLVVPVLVGDSRTVAVVEFEHYPRVRQACVDVLERPRGTVVGGVPEVCVLVVVVGNPAQVAAVDRYRCPTPDVV